MAGRVDGIALGSIGVGTILVYAGLRNVSIPAALQGIIQGKSPQRLAGTGGHGIAQATGPGESGTATGTGVDVTSPGPSPAGTYSQAQLVSLWTRNGGDPNTANFAALVAMSESSGETGITSSNPDGGTNVGLFQLDTKGVGSGYTIQELSDPNLNCQITIMATHNGTDWTEWSDPVVNSLPGHQYTPGG